MAITASWIAASIVSGLSSGFSAHSHHRSKERRANFTRVLFQREFTDKFHDAFVDDIGFNANPQALRIKANARGRRPPSQAWKTFLHNHADGIASMDLFVVPTISFRLLYGLLILHHNRRQILWLGVTAHPTAEWISHQLTEAYGWKVAPLYIIRDRDAVYGDVFIRRLRAMSIRDRPTAPRSPWQNGYCERAIGSIRRECLDHVVVFGEWHLRHLLRSYATYYNAARTHLSVNKDSPSPRTVHSVGRILPTPFIGGLHHLYVRV
jgi:hypothetical protein